MAKALSTYLTLPQMSYEAKQKIQMLMVFQQVANESPSYMTGPISWAAVNGDNRLMAMANGRRKTVAEAPDETRNYISAALTLVPRLVQEHSNVLAKIYELANQLSVSAEEPSADTIATRLLEILGHDAASAPNMIAFWQAEAHANAQVVEQGEDFPQVDREWSYWEDMFSSAIFEEDDLIEVYKMQNKVYVLRASDAEEETALYAVMPLFIADEEVMVVRDIPAHELQGDRGESISKGTMVVLKSVDYDKDAPTVTVWFRNKTWRIPMKSVKI